MKRIEKYVGDIIKESLLTKKEAIEYRTQFIDHINSLKEDYIENGFSEEESTKRAIKDFGDQKHISCTLGRKLNLKNGSKIILLILLFIILLFLLPRYANFAFMDRVPNAEKLIIANLIPFRVFKAIIKLVYFYGMNLAIADHLINDILLFIPIGAIIPFFMNQNNPMKSSLLIFIFTSIICQIFKLVIFELPINIDYAIMHLLGLLIGYGIYKLIVRNNVFKKIIFE